jgi:hypothetical protein
MQSLHPFFGGHACYRVALLPGNSVWKPPTGQSSLDGYPRALPTDFPLTDNPISEDGNWISGGTVGLDWGNVQTTPGLAFGTVVSGGPPYNDSTAVLSGTWGANQTACGTIYTVNETDSICEEVELRLRTTVTAHSIAGYELGGRVTSDGSQYLGITPWNGPLNNFTGLTKITGPGLHNGDRMCASIQGSTLKVFVNGTQVVQATASTYAGGSPGIGFWNQGGTLADNSNYGFTQFSATDGPPSSILNAPASLFFSPDISPTHLLHAWPQTGEVLGCSWTRRR